MKTIRPTFQYLLHGFAFMSIIAFISILMNVAITNLIYHLTARYQGNNAAAELTVPVEVTAGVFALVIGMILFLINFKVALANGVSRKSFLLANLPAAALLAAALALFNIIVLAVHRLFWPAVMPTQLTFPAINLPGLLALQTALYLLLVFAGWFISLAYYRSTNAGRWAISLAPVALYALFRVLNAQMGGGLGLALREYWLVTMRSTPLAAVLTLLAYAAALYGLVYLLLRRAPVR